MKTWRHGERGEERLVCSLVFGVSVFQDSFAGVQSGASSGENELVFISSLAARRACASNAGFDLKGFVSWNSGFVRTAFIVCWRRGNRIFFGISMTARNWAARSW